MVKPFSPVLHDSIESFDCEGVVDTIITRLKPRRSQRCIIYIRGYQGDFERLEKAAHDAVATRYGKGSKRHKSFFISKDLSDDVIAISY